MRTVFIIHGYTDHKERDIIVALRRGNFTFQKYNNINLVHLVALIENLQLNVIVVDWKRIAGLIYFNAASYTFAIGTYLYKFLQFLEQHSVDLSNVHLIGHSLGAQISGVAGAFLQGRIGRITGKLFAKYVWPHLYYF